MDLYKKLGVDPKKIKPGDLLKARAQMSQAYLEKEKKENYAKMTAKEKAHEKRESKIHEIAEHLTKEEVESLKRLVNSKRITKDTKVKIMSLI